MPRMFVIALVALFACRATSAAEAKSSVIISGHRCCVKHRIPLISVRGFEAKPLVFVHSAEPLTPICDQRAPNRIWDSQRLYRTQLHPVRGIVTYCPRCQAQFLQCMGGDHRLSAADIKQISQLVLQRKDIRKPIIRILAFDKARALVDAGREYRAGDIFDDVALAKRQGRWVFTTAVTPHYLVGGEH
jgi:hypothetical protein